jgi:hypothetical protein
MPASAARRFTASLIRQSHPATRRRSLTVMLKPSWAKWAMRNSLVPLASSKTGSSSQNSSAYASAASTLRGLSSR